MIDLNVALTDSATGKPVGGAIVRIDTLPNLAIFPPTRTVNQGGPGTCNFYHGPPISPVQVVMTVEAAGYVPWTNGDTPLTFGDTTIDLPVSLVSFKRPFKPAPRVWAGNMCGVRVPGLPAVPGGAADASLVLSWFYDRYTSGSRQLIRQRWKAKGDTHVLLSWPDSRAFGQSPQQFLATCRELIADGFYPCVMLCAKDIDPPDVPAILGNIASVLPLLVGVVPMFCVGWELSLWLSPSQVQALVDALAPQWLKQHGTLGYVHFQQGYFAFQQPLGTTADFWWLQVGKLTGILHQRDLSWDKPMYQARITDCLQRFNGAYFFPTDSGFGHPFDFVALEITAQPQFNGEMSEADGDAWGQVAINTPSSGDVSVMGSGNGF